MTSNQVVTQVSAGTSDKETSVALEQVLASIAPTDTGALATVPKNLPLSPEVSTALSRLPQVYQSVVPTEVRALNPQEVYDLLDERVTLDTVKKATEARLGEIKTTVLNHIDLTVPDEAPRDSSGHKVVAAKVRVAELGKAFSWEPKNGSGTLSADALAQLDAEGKIDHELYLTITRPVRVVDEAGLLTALRKDPDLLAKIAEAVESKPPSGALFVRSSK